MKYLLDTHVVLWALENDPRLGLPAREWIQDLRNEIYVSVVSLWGFATKKQKYQADFPYDVKSLLPYLQGAGYRLLGLSAEDVLAYSSLQDKDPDCPHKDPFDRLLVSQAKAAGMAFLTHDAKMAAFDEPCIHSI